MMIRKFSIKVVIPSALITIIIFVVSFFAIKEWQKDVTLYMVGSLLYSFILLCIANSILVLINKTICHFVSYINEIKISFIWVLTYIVFVVVQICIGNVELYKDIGLYIVLLALMVQLIVSILYDKIEESLMRVKENRCEKNILDDDLPS